MIRHATAFKSFVLLGWAALFSAAATADPLTDFDTFSFSPIELPSSTQTLHLNKFNSALGELSGVRFTFTALVETEVFITHNEGGAAVVEAGAKLEYGLLSSRQVIQTITTTTQIPKCTGGPSSCSFKSGLAKEVLEIWLPTGELGLYVGPGEFSVDVTASAIPASFDANETLVINSARNSATGSVRVTYVPEPGSLALLAVSCIALGVLQRRRTQIHVGASRASGPAKRAIA